MSESESATPTLDRRFRIGLAISVVSFLLIGVGLFAVVSALSSDNANLPHEGSIEDIANEGGSGVIQALPGGPQNVDWPSGPLPTRIEITRIGVDAPIIRMSFEPGTRVPDVPKTAYQAASYDFNPVPGVGYNALFSGHVDWQTRDGSPIPGVFYRLRELRIGDEIRVTLEDGNVLTYKVTGNVAAKFDDPNVLKAMAPIQKDVITLVTCGGGWEPNPTEENGGNYTHRIVVRAERVASVGVG
jgi:LPXTG-site transpeptidase (sortase) family protein